MLPPVDTHVHLLAGLDDGPRDADEALAMARMLVADGVRTATALAHQNDLYPDNTPENLLNAAAAFEAKLKEKEIPLHVVPTGEVMLTPDLVERFNAGRFLTYGNKGKYLLVEMPHAIFVDPLPIAAQLRPKGVRLVIAHAERYPELLYGGPLVERWIAAGCLIQVTSRELAEPSNPAGAKVLKDWITRGIVHMLGTDGHRLDMRQPRMKAGVDAVRKWAGDGVADRISNLWASSVMQGRAVNPPPPVQIKKSWFGKLLGG
ncbi:tyrosine protein phosphatase [soil metagenome]